MNNNTPNARDYFVGSLMDLLKIDTINPINIGVVEQMTNSIPQKEFINFISFIAKSNNEYKKPIEIIGTAVKEFEKIRIEQIKNTGLEDEMRKLVDKCRYIATSAYDNKPKGLNFTVFALHANFLNFPNAFTLEEQEILSKVGGCKRWLISHDDNSFLTDLIQEKIKSLINYQSLSSISYESPSIFRKLQIKQTA
ncbi:MAG: hypothetical protein PHG81_05625 [Aliarcobacter sp.]|jgi:hypothetical protein|nr:hypothetical protein [Aliarcobacter sp.]